MIRTHEVGRAQAETELVLRHVETLKAALIRLTNEAERSGAVHKSEIVAARVAIATVTLKSKS